MIGNPRKFLSLLCLATLISSSASPGVSDSNWRRVEQILSGVARIYYTEPDADAMLRGALLEMTKSAPRARFDATSHESLYRIRIGRKLVASPGRPQDVDDVMAAIVKVSEVLYRRTRVPSRVFVDAGLRGAIMALGNCYTVYLTPDMVQRLSFAKGETPADVGISLACGSSGRVRHVRPGSPAYLAGIEIGDQLRSIDGKSTEGLDAAEMYALLTGRAGSQVRLGITRRTGVDLTVELTRRARTVDRPRVEDLSGRSIVYVRPGPMSKRTTKLVAPRLECSSRRGVVLDLRSNEGGLVDEAERFASLFVDPGPIASIEGRGKRVLGRLSSKSTGPCANVPMVILVDRETASAAELIAQALRERRKAPLIGQPTFGKGSVQQFLRFEDGSVAKVTTARYLSPNGKPLDRSLQPDVMLPDSGLHLGAHGDPTVDPAIRVAIGRLLPPPPPP